MDQKSNGMMYVICFYWQGDRWNKNSLGLKEPTQRRLGDFNDDLVSAYINNLYKGVEKFANQDFQFICFTNEDVNVDKNVELRSFPVKGSGVLPRMYMFSEESGLFGHQVLCIDLDVVIVNHLDNIMNYRGLICTRSRFNRGEKHKSDGDIISFYGCEENEKRFWKPVKETPSKINNDTGGRERFWISQVTKDKTHRWDNFAPGEVCSYKMHIKKGVKKVKDSTIISFHGFPRPHQCDDSWLKDYWSLNQNKIDAL